MEETFIYLDYASHTQADEAIIAEFCRVERECAGNPLAAHEIGRKAHAELERATEGIAALLDVTPSEIIFTSGTSEANNLAIKGITRVYAHSGRHILSTCLEHPSVSGTVAFLGETGCEIELLKILPNGTIDLTHLKAALRKDTILLCVSAVDSELGAAQPLVGISKIVAQYPNCHLHIDAAQAMGKIPVPIKEISKFSTLCFSPHKFHGLCGLGVLIKREGVVLEPLIHGGSSSFGALLYRGGTPSSSMAAACRLALQNALHKLDENQNTVRHFREYVLENLPSKIKVNSPPTGSPYILNLSVDGIKGLAFQAALNKRGIAVSVKSSCSTDSAPSRPVFAVTNNKKTALCSWRVSFSHHTTRQELDEFLCAVNDIIKAI